MPSAQRTHNVLGTRLLKSRASIPLSFDQRKLFLCVTMAHRCIPHPPEHPTHLPTYGPTYLHVSIIIVHLYLLSLDAYPSRCFEAFSCRRTDSCTPFKVQDIVLGERSRNDPSLPTRHEMTALQSLITEFRIEVFENVSHFPPEVSVKPGVRA